MRNLELNVVGFHQQNWYGNSKLFYLHHVIERVSTNVRNWSSPWTQGGCKHGTEGEQVASCGTASELEKSTQAHGFKEMHSS